MGQFHVATFAHFYVATNNTVVLGWERRLEASPWVEKRGQALGRVLDIVSQWSGATLNLVRRALDQSSRGRAAQNAGRTLHDLGLIDRLWHGGKRRCRTVPKGR